MNQWLLVIEAAHWTTTRGPKQKKAGEISLASQTKTQANCRLISR
jgi:hypothetical protein